MKLLEKKLENARGDAARRKIKVKLERLNDSKWSDKFTRVLVIVSTIGYVQLTQLSVQSFQAGNLAPMPGEEEHQRTFAHDPSIAFVSDSHIGVMVLSGLILFFVTFGIPIWIYKKTQKASLM